MAVRVVVVGAGHLGTYHLQKLAADDQAELIGAVDVSPEKRERVQETFSIPAEPSLQAFEGRVDAAIIATPTVHHLEAGLEAIGMGLHVLIEKPIAQTVGEARTLVEAARSAGRLLQVGHTERFNPAVSASLALLDTPGYIVAERLGPFTGRSTDIDVVLDLMIHDLDIVATLVKSPLKEARSVGVPVFTAETDMAAARLEFENGSVAQLSASRGSLEPSRKIRVFTRERYVSIDCQAREVKSIRRAAGSQGTLMQLAGEPVEVPPGDALANQDHDFLMAIQEQRAPVVDGEQGLRALELAEAVKTSLTIPIPS